MLPRFPGPRWFEPTSFRSGCRSGRSRVGVQIVPVLSQSCHWCETPVGLLDHEPGLGQRLTLTALPVIVGTAVFTGTGGGDQGGGGGVGCCSGAEAVGAVSWTSMVEPMSLESGCRSGCGVVEDRVQVVAVLLQSCHW